MVPFFSARIARIGLLFVLYQFGICSREQLSGLAGGSTSQSWCRPTTEFLSALLEKLGNFMCSEEWLPQKYILDESLNVTRIGGRVKVENEKSVVPLHMSCPLAFPLMKSWRRHWEEHKILSTQ